MLRYRFSEFTLSPQRRLLVRDGREVPLIPRYFDLLLLLIERRREAVHRREIFDRVWADAVVSESALSQAVRTIRATLGDDSREPRFIRTVSRHGYQFVFPDVIEEEEQDETSHPQSSGGDADAVPDAPSSVGAGYWNRAAAGAAVAGIVTGGVGGLMLAFAPGSAAPIAIAPVLAVVGGVCGIVGGAGVGAGLAAVDAAVRPHRTLLMTVAAALGGGSVGLVVQWLTRWALAALIGLDLHAGGGLEGVVIGAAAGLGFATATRRGEDGMPWPRGHRLHAALLVAAFCGLGALALALTGRPLVSGTIDALAKAAHGSRAALAPLARLVGEPDLGPVSSAILAFAEGMMFGLGLSFGVLRRPHGGQTPDLPGV